MAIEDKALFNRVKEFNKKFPKFEIKDLSKLSDETAKEALRVGLLNAQKFMKEEAATLEAAIAATSVAGGSGVNKDEGAVDATDEDLDSLLQGTVDGKDTKKGAKFKQTGTLRECDPELLVVKPEDVKTTNISTFKTAEDIHSTIADMDVAAGNAKKAAARLVLDRHLAKAKEDAEAVKLDVSVKQQAAQDRLDALRATEAAAVEAAKAKK